MRKSKKEQLTFSPMNLKQKALNAFEFDFDRTPVELQPAPTRYFDVGEEIISGRLQGCVIEEVLWDGMAYLYRCQSLPERNVEPTIDYRVSWWFEIYKIKTVDTDVRLMTPYKCPELVTSVLDSLTHYMLCGGLVCDPSYQREYVWSEENKDSLIESIFDRVDIGSFLLVRHAGFNHSGDNTLRTYRTLSGKEVVVPACNDYTIAIIDGQQRLTTIIDFLMDRRPYRGVYFSNLHPSDRREFEHTTVAYRLLKEETTSQKEILRLFLQSNRGVPQTPEHLAKVQKLYEALV